MKQAMPYLVVSIVTLVLAVQLALVLYLVKPEVFMALNSASAAPPVTASKPPDSVAATIDSVRTEAKDSTVAQSTIVVTDESVRDSMRALEEKLQAETQKAAVLELRLSAHNTPTDSSRSKQIKDTAKMLESMSAEDAARILQNLSLSEARQVLMVVKKKQAGKILSAMEPRLAARMIR